MISQNFIFFGVIISFIGGLSYLIDTVKGKTKPNKVTWFLWFLAPTIAFSAEIKQGVGLQSLLTFMVGFNPLLIFIASFVNRKSQWKVSRLDYVCGLFSICGIIFWLITKTGNIAIIFSILADGLAAAPTVVKSYHFPETENYKVYLGGAILSTITLLTIKNWTIAEYAFPLYILVINIVLISLIKFKFAKLFKG